MPSRQKLGIILENNNIGKKCASKIKVIKQTCATQEIQLFSSIFRPETNKVSRGGFGKSRWKCKIDWQDNGQIP